MAYKYSVDISDNDLLRVEIFSVAVQCDPIDALATWESESGNYTTAWNHNGNASGINQAMPATLKGLGYRPDITDDVARATVYRTESYLEQMKWVQRYYMPYKGKLKSRAAFYVATFLPADLDYAANGNDDTVLVQKDGRRGWAFSANAGFDANHDLKITVGELTQAINRACTSNRWKELSERMSAQLKIQHVVHEVTPLDLGTTLGIQQALDKLGIVVGPIDGLVGQLTRNAVMQYQKSKGLSVDGIPGPDTRAAISKDLASA